MGSLLPKFPGYSNVLPANKATSVSIDNPNKNSLVLLAQVSNQGTAIESHQLKMAHK